MELICKEEPIKASISRGDAKALAEGCTRAGQKKWTQDAMDSGLAASAADARAALQAAVMAHQKTKDCPAVVHQPCAYCKGAGAHKKCQACWVNCRRYVSYCNADCQKSDWKDHRAVCGKQAAGTEEDGSSTSNPTKGDVLAALQGIDIAGRSKTECLRLVKERHPEWVLSAKRFAGFFKEAVRSNS